ncbi:MAG: hypothetical protein HFG28_02210 [Eubacterium sp.]|nr:hypothetical protein [Eubacterium sp.]
MKKTKIICVGLMLCMLVTLNVNLNIFASTTDGKELFFRDISDVEVMEENNLQRQGEKINIEEQQKILKIMGWEDEECDESDLNNNYAGTYLDDNDKLVVMLDEDAKGNTKLEKRIKKIDVNTKVKKVKYNCKELAIVKEKYDEKMCWLSKMKKIGKLTHEQSLVLKNVIGCGITLEKNCVTVYMKKINKYYKDLFEKHVFKSKILRFQREKAEDKTANTKLKLGRAVYKHIKTTYSGNKKMVSSSICSIGLKAYTIDSNGKKRYGFVTCGHGLSIGDSIYIDALCEKKIGRVIKRKFSGKVDASFVEVTNSNYTPSRVVYYSDSSGKISGGATISTSYLYAWYTGFTVYKAGATTYLTSGKLTDYSYSTNVSDAENGTVTMKDLYRAKIKVKQGDSGGIFYTKDDGEYCALGITESISGNYANFVKWNNIDDKFNIYFY